MTRAVAAVVVATALALHLLPDATAAPAKSQAGIAALTLSSSDRGDGAKLDRVGTMSTLASDQTRWLRRVYFLVGHAVFGVAGYDPHGSFAVRFTVAPDGRGHGFRVRGGRARATEDATIVDAIAATRFPPPPDGRPRIVTYHAMP